MTPRRATPPPTFPPGPLSKPSRTTGIARIAALRRPTSSPWATETRTVSSSEQALQLLHERRLLWLDVLPEILRELRDELFLRLRQLRRDLDGHLDELIAAPGAEPPRDAFAPHAEH